MTPEFPCTGLQSTVPGDDGGCTCLGCEANRALAAERAKLPDGMKHCTILFRQCEKGHGWLTATSWVDFGCPTCERDAVRAAERSRCLAAVAEVRDRAEKGRVLVGSAGPSNVDTLTRGALSALRGVESLIKDESWTSN